MGYQCKVEALITREMMEDVEGIARVKNDSLAEVVRSALRYYIRINLADGTYTRGGQHADS